MEKCIIADCNDKLIKIAVLMDNFKSEDINLRIQSIKSLAEISSYIGVEKSKNELIPFLKGIYYLILYIEFVLYDLILRIIK
jgi:hypothetical protein